MLARASAGLVEDPVHHVNHLAQIVGLGLCPYGSASRALYSGAESVLLEVWPSPTGDFVDPHDTAAHFEALRYLRQIPREVFAAIPMHVEVPPLTKDELFDRPRGESTRAIAFRVQCARERQAQRTPGRLNAALDRNDIQRHCRLGVDCESLFRHAHDQLDLNARSHDQILQVSRTIADLDGEEEVRVPHLAEAIQYRAIDRRLFSSCLTGWERPAELVERLCLAAEEQFPWKPNPELAARSRMEYALWALLKGVGVSR
jgi:hypothetical protein